MKNMTKKTRFILEKGLQRMKRTWLFAGKRWAELMKTENYR